MTIEDFLRKIVKIDLTQAQHVFYDWDEALENYVLRYGKHSSSNVLRLLKMSSTLGELVDLYRGVVLNLYPCNGSKADRYNELLSHYNYRNGTSESMFERISNGSTMEERLNFMYLIAQTNALQREDIDKRKILRNLREGKLYDSSNQVRTKAYLESRKS